jgi:hypothetical protein
MKLIISSTMRPDIRETLYSVLAFLFAPALLLLQVDVNLLQRLVPIASHIAKVEWKC